MPTKIIASCLALVGFAAAILAGLSVDNPATTTITRAIVAMAACYVLGSILGSVAQRAVQEHVEHYKKQHPLDPAAGGATEDSTQSDKPTNVAPAARATGSVAT